MIQNAIVLWYTLLSSTWCVTKLPALVPLRHGCALHTHLIKAHLQGVVSYHILEHWRTSIHFKVQVGRVGTGQGGIC